MTMAPLRRARRRRGHVPLLSLLSLLAALTQIMAAAAAGANAEVDAAADHGDSANTLFTVMQPARSVTSEGASSLEQQVVAPSLVA